MAIRRALPLWLVLLAAYAVTLPFDAGRGTTLAPAEAHRLLVAESIVSDGDVDLRDEYATRAWRDWYGSDLRPTAALTSGRRLEPVGLGFAALIAPAYALGGPTAVRMELAALAALAFCLAAALGRTLVPEPWATRSALVCGLSPPAMGAATTVAPEMAGAAALAGAALLALRVRQEPRLSWTAWSAALVAALPWLAAKLAGSGAVVAGALARWLWRRQRGLTGFIALEVVLTSGVLYLTVHDRLFGGPTPHDLAPGGATGASGLADHLARAGRLVTVWLDPGVGMLLWAPFVALAFVAVVLLWRSRRGRLAVAVAGQADVEAAAAFLAAIVAAGVLVAVFLAPSLGGAGHPAARARQLVPVLPELAALSAWGLRFAPRAGAVLAAATLALTVALLA
jgi:nitrate reductase gamma subunit